LKLAYIGVGANLGDALNTLRAVLLPMSQWSGTLALSRSRFYKSAAVGTTGPNFFNMVVRMETTWNAEHLLEEMLALELRFGRERPYRYAPRTLDLDLLLFGQPTHWQTMNTAFLTLPHPRMHERAFVLQPLLDLQPDMRLPERGSLDKVLSDLMRRAPQTLEALE
jgi:2-amino-4-hydroxy-6-hydroxymethyldihydropteridine diphosphokinase